MPKSDGYAAQSQWLKALAHPVRLQILEILRDGEACVCHLEAALGYRQAYLSQQLGVLRRAGLLAERKSGLFAYYRVANPDLFDLLDELRQRFARQAKQSGRTIEFRSVPKVDEAKCDCPRCAEKAE